MVIPKTILMDVVILVIYWFINPFNCYLRCFFSFLSKSSNYFSDFGLRTNIIKLKQNIFFIFCQKTLKVHSWNLKYISIDYWLKNSLYFSSFIHGIQLFYLFNRSSVPVKMLKIRIKKISLHFECLRCTNGEKKI